MKHPKPTSRTVKAELQAFFDRKKSERNFYLDDDDKPIVDFILAYPAVSLSPLMAFLSSPDPVAKWGAVMLIGHLVGSQAEIDMEWARTVLRKFMWYLNDESGGMGWGVPEAMGEILRHHHGLAVEYGKILWSYIDPEGNHLENDDLVEGALWGIARVATSWNDIYPGSCWKTLALYRASHRALTRLCAGIVGVCFQKMGNAEIAESLVDLMQDAEKVSLFWDGGFIEGSVGEIVSLSHRWILWQKDTNIT